MKPLDPPSDLVAPPGENELPYDDGEPLETNRHRLQMTLLAESLDRDLGARRPDYFVGANMFLYFSALQVKKNDFRGPDVFVALGVERRDRKSWVMWEESSKAPDVVIELTSESTTADDHGAKKRVYALLGVQEYFIYDPITGALEGFRFAVEGYQPLAPTESGRLPSAVLDLEFGVWQGEYQGYDGPWMRGFRGGRPVPIAEEDARAERRLREDAERKLAEALAEVDRLKGK